MKNILIQPIRYYQKHISPHTPPSCRYHPTCSTYAIQAIEKHGAVKGGIMAGARIIRCNPFIEGGVDEVPDYFTVRRNPDNVDDFYIPEYLMPADKEAQARSAELLDVYEDELHVSDSLASPTNVLHTIADVKALDKAAIEKRFSKDELDYLIEVEIFPDLNSADFRYFTLEDTEKNKPFLDEIEPYIEETDVGLESPLVVLEKTGLWYTNLPKLGRAFLIERGVTPKDIDNKSYHLWMVLDAIDKVHKES